MISSVLRSSFSQPPKNCSISIATRSQRSSSVSVTLSTSLRDNASFSLGERRCAFAQTSSIVIPIMYIFQFQCKDTNLFIITQIRFSLCLLSNKQFEKNRIKQGLTSYIFFCISICHNSSNSLFPTCLAPITNKGFLVFHCINYLYHIMLHSIDIFSQDFVEQVNFKGSKMDKIYFQKIVMVLPYW